jgi:signal transduction histidine kinase
MLILLPLCLLATLGVLSLRQDRLLARHSATERAREIAETLTSQTWAEIQRIAEQAPERFCVDRSGELLYPPAVQRMEDLSAIHEDTQSSEARALFAESLQHAKAREIDKALEGLATVAARFPEATGETGLPLKPLAEYKILELSKAGAKAGPEWLNLSLFCSNLVHQPTAMTPFLLEKAKGLATDPMDGEIPQWEAAWTMHESGRHAYHTASLLYSNLWLAPPLIRESIAPARFLAKLSKTDTNMWFARLSAPALQNALHLPASRAASMPSYMDLRIYVGGAPFPPAVEFSDRFQQAAGEKPELLASSQRNEGDAELVRVDVLLTSPSLLFAHQRTRTYWFGALIALSAGTAFFGLAGAWISFREQARLSEMKSNFVSSVSHELRAPIGSVRLMAENLERGAVKDENKRTQYFRLIGHECRRLSSLIENVLDFSRIEQGRKQYELEASDLSRIVTSTVQLMQPLAEQKQINLAQADSTDAIPSLAVDGKALQQALVNLIDNAIKHSPKGSTVTAGIDLSKGGVELWVEDHGIGIPKAEHQRIFDRFYRLGAELRRETQGVGIGLSIVKHVAEAHGGRVQVRSAPGKGSRFTIQLPGNPAKSTA